MKRRSGFTKVELIIVVVFIGMLAAILLPAFTKVNPSPPRVQCISKMKQIAMAFMQYAQENDERFPPVKISDEKRLLPEDKTVKPFGWADAVFVFVQDNELYQCPSEDIAVTTKNPTQSGYTDYWYNTNLSKLELGKLTSPTQTILMGDGNDGTENTDARYNLNTLPQKWRDTEDSPARRHLDLANYAFADGHVKTIKPQKISTLPTKQSSHTFSIR